MKLNARPRCYICGKLVDSLEEVEFFGRHRLIARCHGDTQIVDLADSDNVGAFGFAFQQTRSLPEKLG